MNKKSYEYTVKNIRPKFYNKGQHKSLKGQTIHADVQTVENNEIVEEHIILNYIDIVKAIIEVKKQRDEYRNTK